MTNRDQKRPRRIVLVASLAMLCLALALVGTWSFVRRGLQNVSLADSPFLRDVSEPIAIIKGSLTAGSDDHWMGLTFRDAKQVEKEARYIYYWPPVQNHPGYSHALLLGQEVPPGGREERAFLGLLQRWYRGDDEARQLWARVENRDPSLGRTPFGWDGLTEPQAGKVVAVSMMKVLERRN
jgi:hypothetical protein